MFEMVDFARNREFVMSTQYATSGGFSKWPDCYADPMHTYLGQYPYSVLSTALFDISKLSVAGKEL